VALYGKCTRALTFENFFFSCQGTRDAAANAQGGATLELNAVLMGSSPLHFEVILYACTHIYYIWPGLGAGTYLIANCGTLLRFLRLVCQNPKPKSLNPKP
jgi:hypothetical protein